MIVARPLKLAATIGYDFGNIAPQLYSSIT